MIISSNMLWIMFAFIRYKRIFAIFCPYSQFCSLDSVGRRCKLVFMNLIEMVFIFLKPDDWIFFSHLCVILRYVEICRTDTRGNLLGV